MIAPMAVRRRPLPFPTAVAVGLAVLAGCGLETAGFGPGDAFDRPPGDDAGDTPEDVAEEAGDSLICPPATSWCSLDAVMLCSEDGLSFEATPCPLGCSGDPWAHCLELAPSNVADPALLCEGAARLTLLPGTSFVFFGTGDGTIEEWSATGVYLREYRPAGEGPINGVHFVAQDQEAGAPPLGVFSFAGLELPASVTLRGVGPAALVVLACGDVTIDGTVSVGAAQYTDGTGTLRRVPGPGGSDAGLGFGAGGDGVWDASLLAAGGGGGGGYGGSGGPGGSGGYFGAVLIGAAGRLHGEPELVPLRGGSGGGDGAFEFAPRGRGGPGGGALQITARGALVVRGRIDAGGLGGTGGGDDYYGGGGGGGSGGGILLEAERLVVETGAVIAANGGGGGSGTGYSAYGYQSNPGQRGEARLTPAAGGADPGTFGCAGGAGSGATEIHGGSVGCISGDDTYGGGGGGGAGRIRLNSITGEIARNALSPADGAPHTTTTTGRPSLR
jgi:hypothetical protein